MLPSIVRRLEEFPAGARVIVFVEVADAAEEQPLTSHADVRLTWLHRDGAAAGTTDLLERAVRKLEFPAGDYYAWISGEAKAADCLGLTPARTHRRCPHTSHHDLSLARPGRGYMLFLPATIPFACAGNNLDINIGGEGLDPAQVMLESG